MPTPKKLLLVEDQAIIALAEAGTLGRAGYEVEVALSGEEAIEGIRRDGGIDLVLMDIDLGPGMNGAEAARRILAVRPVPIVFLTAHAERGMVEKVRDIGHFGYVIKDSGEFVLLSSIEMAFELFEAQRRLAEERNDMRQVLESIEEAFYLKDVESGKMLLISPSYERIWGLPREELERDPASFMAAVHPEDLPRVEACRAEMAAGGRAFDMEYRILRPGGELRWVRAQTKRIEDPSGRGSRFAATALDITDHKLDELELADERRRLRAVLAAIPSLVILTGPDSETPIYVSENSLRLTGYSPEELKSGFHEFAREGDRERVALAIKEAFEKRNDFDGFEFDAVRKDGVPWQASASWRSIFDDSGAYKGRVFQVIDVTRLRRAESSLRESEQKYRAIADYTADWESWFGPSGEYLWVNPAVEQITGYSREEILAMPDFIASLIAEEDMPAFVERFREAVRSPEAGSNYEFRFVRRDGQLRWLSVSWTPIFDDAGRYLGLRASGRDVTDRKLGEERIAQLLAEKELLLREVHHRIKNNMSLVASMFAIQEDMILDPAARSALSDMRGRIMGMMILYDKLYRSEGAQDISARGYLGALLDGIAAEYSGSSGALLAWDIVDRAMDSRLLFPLGIIVNELVTNAFKYAFPGGVPGKIELAFLEIEGGGLELRVADDGIGIADSALAALARPGGGGGFGFLLVKTLTEQIGGKLERGRNCGRGAEFLLRFSA